MWPIQQYTKFALATAYFPDSSYEAAIRRLRRWIDNNESLKTNLVELGYHPNQRHFTARQTALIFEYLGEPWLNKHIVSKEKWGYILSKNSSKLGKSVFKSIFSQ